MNCFLTCLTISTTIASASIIAILTVALIIVSIYFMKYKRETEAKLLHSKVIEDELDKLEDTVSTSIIQNERVTFFYKQSLFGVISLSKCDVTYMNSVAKKTLNLLDSEVKQWTFDNIFNLIYEEDKDKVRALIKHDGPVHHSKAQHHHCRVVSKRGDLRWLDLYFRRLTDGGAETTLITFIDETELREVEEQVNIFKRFVETSGLGLITVDENMVPIFINNSFCEILKYKESTKILSKNLYDLYPESFLTKLKQEIIPTILERGKWTGELPLIDKEGKYTSTLQSFFKLDSNANRKEHIAIVVHDLSYHKNIDDELILTRSLVKSVICSMPMPIFTVDEKNKITYCNKALKKLLSKNLDELLYNNVYEVIPFMRRFTELIEKALSEHKSIESLKEVIALNRVKHVFNISFMPMNLDFGKSIIIKMEDISQLNGAQERDFIIQKIEAINQVALKLAEDFNVILSNIRNSLSIMNTSLTDVEFQNKSLLSKEIETTDVAVETGMELISEILELSSDTTFNKESIDLNNIINRVVNLSKSTFDDSVKIKHHNYDDPAVVQGDTAKLESALFKLCQYSEKAVLRSKLIKNKEVRITIDIIYADKHFCMLHSQATEGYYWVLRISYLGQGLQRREVSNIFEPYISVNQLGNNKIALASVYNTIRLHRGFIDVYSEEEAGTTFSVYLPESSLSEVGNEIETDNIEKLSGNGVVMVVDDDKQILDIAANILEEFGYNVLTANNGLEAMDVYRDNGANVDLIILDMSMPILSGQQTLSRIREINPTQKVIMASGFAQDDRIEDFKGLGPVELIQKPYSMYELGAKIKEIINDEEIVNVCSNSKKKDLCL